MSHIPTIVMVPFSSLLSPETVLYEAGVVKENVRINRSGIQISTTCHTNRYGFPTWSDILSMYSCHCFKGFVTPVTTVSYSRLQQCIRRTLLTMMDYPLEVQRAVNDEHCCLFANHFLISAPGAYNLTKE